MDTGQIIVSWIPAIVALLGAALAWLTFARGQRRDRMEYFERTAKDLTERYEKLESRFKDLELKLARYELAIRYLKQTKVVPEIITMVMDDITEGRLSYREAIDPTEDHE